MALEGEPSNIICCSFLNPHSFARLKKALAAIPDLFSLLFCRRSNTCMVVLKLKPHPELSKSQKKIIERDYGMSNGVLLFKVRESMLIYVLTQLRIDRFSNQRTAAEQQIVLENTEVLESLGLQV